MKYLLVLFFVGFCLSSTQTIYSPQAYEKTDTQKLEEVATLLKSQPEGVDQRHGLVHLLHASLHQNIPPSYLESGYMVNELHPPTKVVVHRFTKSRKMPHRDGEVARRITAGSVLVALGTTPDMLWLQVGKDEFIPTKDARLEEPLNREQPVVSKLTPPLDIHVKGEVTVRKIPDIGGKPVGQLHNGELLTAIGVTPDYAWLMIGNNQFIPTFSAKVGDPTTPLNPPLTIHIRSDTIVRDAPSMQGKPVTVLKKNDIMQAIAVSADLLWLKLAHNNYIKTTDCKMGLPLPPLIDFPQPLVVKLIEDAQVVKNPNHPEQILRWLKKDDELQVFGSTADFKWLVVAKKRFIPMNSAVMKEAIPKPLPLTPSVPIKISTGSEVRDIPDKRGKVVLIVRKGEKFEASAVSADFDWLQIGPNLWIPLTSAFFRNPTPITNPLVPPMRVTLLKDTKVRKTPDSYGKIVKTLGEGDTLVAIAATPDLAWIKVGDKEFIPADGVKMEDQLLTAPLFPYLTVVVTKDVKVLKAPNKDALPVRRLKRGEVLEIHETTTDLKWLKIAENQYIPTEYTSHISHTSPLTPPVRVVVAADVKVRNVPAFAGMTMKDLKKGEIIDAVEVSPDFKWLKLAKDQYVPASGCVLHESEGKDMLVVLKIRNSHVDKDPVVAQKPTKQPDQKITTSQAASLLQQAFEKRITPPAVAPTAPVVDLEKKIQQLRIKENTLVMQRPDETSLPVRGLTKGALVDATGMGTNLSWIKIGPDEFVKLSATEPTEVTTQTA